MIEQQDKTATMPSINPTITKSRSDVKYSQSMMLSENCTSLRSSKLNLASVASELEYNKENASIEDEESVDLPIDKI